MKRILFALIVAGACVVFVNNASAKDLRARHQVENRQYAKWFGPRRIRGRVIAMEPFRHERPRFAFGLNIGVPAGRFVLGNYPPAPYYPPAPIVYPPEHWRDHRFYDRGHHYGWLERGHDGKGGRHEGGERR